MKTRSIRFLASPFLGLSSLALVFVTSTVVAEESPRGRLADGRAYRTDESGTQLVDYIAELEVNAEAMNRRIIGLEDELSEKQRIIERLNRGETGGAAMHGELKERTLTDEPAVAARREDPGAIERMKGENLKLESELRELRTLTAQRGVDESAVRAELERLRAALDTERRLRDQDQATYAAVSRECAAIRTAPKASCDAAVALAVQETTRAGSVRESALQEQLAAVRSDEATLRSQTQARTVELEAMVTGLKAELGQARASLAGVQADLAGARSALAVAARPVAAPAEPVQVSSVAAAVRPVTRDYASRSRVAVVDSLRGSMSSELNKVRSLIVTRDDLFRRSVGRGDPRIQFRPSPLLSTNRRTLDDVAAGIRSAEQVHELTALRTDLAEIRALVQGDIDLLRRTGRVG